MLDMPSKDPDTPGADVIPQRVAFCAWVAVGCVGTYAILGFFSLAIGLIAALTSELKWHYNNTPGRWAIFLNPIFALASMLIQGGLGAWLALVMGASISAGFAFGAAIGTLKGTIFGMMVWYSLDVVKLFIASTGIGAGLGALIGAASVPGIGVPAGGIIGVTISLFVLDFYPMFQLMEAADPDWPGPWWLSFAVWILALGGIITASCVGALTGGSIWGALIAFGIAATYIGGLNGPDLAMEIRGDKLRKCEQDLGRLDRNAPESEWKQGILELAKIIRRYATRQVINENYLASMLHFDPNDQKSTYSRNRVKSPYLGQLLNTIYSSEGFDKFKQFVTQLTFKTGVEWK